jgi:hypothetical protein
MLNQVRRDKHLFRKLIVLCISKLFLFILYIGCEKLPPKADFPYNPYDPNNPNYVVPKVTVTSGLDSNVTLLTDSIVIMLQGNREEMEFHYQLDSSLWTNYSASNSITLTNLDEYNHQLNIQGKYASGYEGEIETIPFNINAVSGPALITIPKRVEIAAGAQFELQLWIDETDSIAGVSTKIIYESTHLRVDKIDFLETNNESFLLANGGRLITFSNIDNTNGIADLDCAVVQGNPRNVVNSGIFARIRFTHLSGTSSTISFSTESKFRSSDNLEIGINNLVGTEIIVNQI